MCGVGACGSDDGFVSVFCRYDRVFCRPMRGFCVAHIYGGWINAWEVYGKNGESEREEEGGGGKEVI